MASSTSSQLESRAERGGTIEAKAPDKSHGKSGPKLQSQTFSSSKSSIVEESKKPDVPVDAINTTAEKNAQHPQDVAQYPEGMEMVFIMLALALSITLVSLDQTIVATAIPRITDEFDSLGDISWYGSAFFLTVGAFQSQWGKVYKYFPLKASFLVAIFVFELGSLISGVARKSTTLIVGRAISGVGGAGIAPGVYTIGAFSAPPSKRATYTGLIGVTYGVAATIGPLIGGGLTAGASWRWCFYVNLPIGGLSALAIFFTFKTPQAATVVDATFREKLLNLDFLGSALVLGASIALVLALQYGGVSHAWNSSLVIGLLVGFVAIVIALIAAEIWQGERAMLTPRLVRQRTVWVNGVWGFLITGAYFVTLYYLPIYFQSIDGVSPIMSGVRNIPFIVLFSISTYATGLAITKTGIAAPYLLASSIITTIAGGLLFTMDIGTSTGKWIGYQILAGFGYGIALQVPIALAKAFSAPADIAPTTAVIIFCRSVGGTFMISAAQSGFVNELVRKLARTAPTVEPAAVIATGATDLHRVFSGAELDGTVRAYAWGIKTAFAITIAACGLSLPVSLLSRWDNIHQKKPGGQST